jgi:hypothetical protein
MGKLSTALELAISQIPVKRYYLFLIHTIQASLLENNNAQPIVKYTKQSKLRDREELRKTNPMPIMLTTSNQVLKE